MALRRRADIRARHVIVTEDASEFEVHTPWGVDALRLQLVGRYNISNAMAALGAACASGQDLTSVCAALSSDLYVPGRLEQVETGHPARCVVDYAHTADALRHVMTTLREITSARLIVVFGCGGDRDREKRPEMGRVAAELADVSILTSDNPRSEKPESILEEIFSAFASSDEVIVEPDRASAIRKAMSIAGQGDTVLIAGKGHEAFQEFENRVIPFDDREELRKAADDYS